MLPIINIQGREAVPVRAIPFLTGWQTMSPDVVATALSGEDFADDFQNFTAYCLRDGIPTKVSKNTWIFVARRLSILSETIKSSQPCHEVGYGQWQEQSISELTAGTFVWRDELEREYAASIRGKSAIRDDGSIMGEDGEWILRYKTTLPIDFEFQDDIPSRWEKQVFEKFEDLIQPSPPISQAPATPQEQAEPEARPDLSMLATPEQLIQAFGRFTGMDNSWFKNLKDYPELEKARKLKGQGGRGHIEPPFFCPYEVMQWLMTKPRKNSRRCAFLTEDKPWQLLKSYFPRVYDMNQGYSPLNDD